MSPLFIYLGISPFWTLTRYSKILCFFLGISHICWHKTNISSLLNSNTQNYCVNFNTNLIEYFVDFMWSLLRQLFFGLQGHFRAQCIEHVLWCRWIFLLFCHGIGARKLLGLLSHVEWNPCWSWNFWRAYHIKCWNMAIKSIYIKSGPRNKYGQNQVLNKSLNFLTFSSS